MTEAKPLSPSSHSFSITFRRLAGQISPEPRRREIEQMVADAEAHRSEDAALRAEVDTRNELDTVAYQVQRTLDENAGRIPEHERARAELLVSDARTALDQQADIDRLRPSPVSCTSYSNHWQLPPGPAPRLELQLVRSESSSGESGDDSDDVIDAEFTTLIMAEQQTHEQQSNEQPPAPGSREQQPSARDPLEEARARIPELEDNWRRIAAELDNFRKRCAKDLVRARQQERARTAAGWLPVIDNLALALEHASSDPEHIIGG